MDEYQGKMSKYLISTAQPLQKKNQQIRMKNRSDPESFIARSSPCSSFIDYFVFTHIALVAIFQYGILKYQISTIVRLRKRGINVVVVQTSV